MSAACAAALCAVPNIVGLGMACELCRKEMDSETKRLLGLRERLRKGTRIEAGGRVPQRPSDGAAAGQPEPELRLRRGRGADDGHQGRGREFSGSACTSASLEPSYVLKALGVGDELAHSSIRFGLGRFNTEEEVDFVIDDVVRAVNHLRDMSPLYEMHKQGIDLKTVQWAAH